MLYNLACGVVEKFRQAIEINGIIRKYFDCIIKLVSRAFNGVISKLQLKHEIVAKS